MMSLTKNLQPPIKKKQLKPNPNQFLVVLLPFVICALSASSTLRALCAFLEQVQSEQMQVPVVSFNLFIVDLNAHQTGHKTQHVKSLL